MDENKQNLMELEMNKSNKDHPSQKKDVFRAIMLTTSY
jgi:hypothetical protein